MEGINKGKLLDYPIVIGQNLLDTFLTYIPHVENYEAFVMITDENVYRLYGEKITHQLYQTGKLAETIVIPAGDESKSLEIYDQIIETMLEGYITKNSLLIAFGGGMIGDLAGFVAGTYMRGIDFIQVPTTLLAHDSAIGGKVALNHPLAKNSIGLFYQPKTVIYDTTLLQTLPDVEWLSGFGEVLKHSEIDSEFQLNIRVFDDIKNVQNYLKDSIDVKRKIVERDPFEKGGRIYLNYGHTFGHALEQHLNYTIPHGICVIYGLMFVALLEKRSIEKYQMILNFIEFEKPNVKPDDIFEIIEFMQRDKKQKGRSLAFLLKEDAYFVMKPIKQETIIKTYAKFIEMM